MRDADGLTPGKLITYQLYWNMMTGAYKGLLDILTSFTRAGGAATRVFALIDSLPDIDIDAGLRVARAPLSKTLSKTPESPSLSTKNSSSSNGVDNNNKNSIIKNNSINSNNNDDSNVGIHDLQGSISMRNVSFAYQMRPHSKVLTDVTVDIPAATVCAIVGKSGGGKSTLVNLMLR
jgi:ABC-type multidrug transport system fused ATPase/permease subunit